MVTNEVQSEKEPCGSESQEKFSWWTLENQKFDYLDPIILAGREGFQRTRKV